MGNTCRVEQVETRVLRNPETGNWLPGASGNPNGRPRKGSTMLDRLIARVEREPELVVEALFAKLCQGDSRVFELYANRAYGVPKQTMEINGEASPMNQLMNVLASRYMAERGITLQITLTSVAGSEPGSEPENVVDGELVSDG